MELTHFIKNVKIRLIQFLFWLTPNEQLKTLFGKSFIYDNDLFIENTNQRTNSVKPRAWSFRAKRKSKKKNTESPSSSPNVEKNPRVDLETIHKHFGKNGFIVQAEFDNLMRKLYLFPTYINNVLFKKLTAGQEKLSENHFVNYWTDNLKSKSSNEALFFVMKSEKTTFLSARDFAPFIREFTDTHPALAFLRSSPTFHQKYMETIIERIFYVANAKTKKLTLKQFLTTDFLRVLRDVETQCDINQVSNYLSYLDFYVILCNFQDLDEDQDGALTAKDLKNYSNLSLSKKIIKRIFETLPDGKMGYKDFIWFILSEVDKTTRTSIEYWFRLVDKDSDGQVSVDDMEFFYEEQIRRTRALGMEEVSSTQIVAQMFDLINPEGYAISLAELKKSQCSSTFFNTLFNLHKHVENEWNDRFIPSNRPGEWEKFVNDVVKQYRVESN
jgi:serine/threonine-protein phosphatase 2A regulatory subunit B''